MILCRFGGNFAVPYVPMFPWNYTCGAGSFQPQTGCYVYIAPTCASAVLPVTSLEFVGDFCRIRDLWPGLTNM